MKVNFKDNDTQPAVELHGLGVLAGGRWIVRGINLSLPTGVCCAMVGPNGCGKSTLARVLAGFVWPTAGRVCVLGETFGDTDLHELRRRVKLVQAANVLDFDSDMTAGDVVLTGAFGTILLFDQPTDEHRARAEELMRWLGIDQLKASRYGAMSTGERMRTLIARALLVPPALLLLDEPTAGLDLIGREMLLAGLDRIMASVVPRPTLLMISHHVEELPSSTDFAVLMRDGGIVAAGAAMQVLAAGPMSAAFGAEIDVVERAGRYSARIERAKSSPI